MKQAKLLTDAEFRRLNAIVNSLRYPTRNQTAIALSFYAGLRACEIAALKVDDVFDETGLVKDTIYMSAAQTKGSDGATVLVNSKLQRQLERFGQQYPVHSSNRAAPLIFSAKGGGFTAQTVVNLFKRIYQSAGIDGASRQFVTNLADKRINARVVQALARHKHLSITQHYIDINDNKLRAEVELL